MQHAAMAAAAALSHPFFLAAAAASSRDVNHPSMEPSSAPRIPSYDDHHHHHQHQHHHLQSSSSSSPTSVIPGNKLFERSLPSKRSLSPGFLSNKQQQQHDDSSMSPASKKFAPSNQTNFDKIPSSFNMRSTCFTPVSTAQTTTASSSALSPVGK